MPVVGIILLLVLQAVGYAVTLYADEAKTQPGQLTIGKHTYKLAHFAAYDARLGDEDMVIVMASDRTIPLDKIKRAIADGKQANDRLISQPHVLVVFNMAGEVNQTSVWTDNASVHAGIGDLTGEITIEGRRARGSARLDSKPDDTFARSFDFKFDVPLGFDAAPKPIAKTGGPVKDSVTGTFKGDDKPARLAFVSARPREPFGGKNAIVLVFTERDHSKEPRPDIKAVFGSFGSALVISVDEEGSLFGCEVAHAAHAKKPFSSLGNLKLDAFELGGGQVSGHLATDGKVDVFDQTWEVDLTFAAPFAESAAKPAAKTAPAAKSPSASRATAKAAPKPPADEAKPTTAANAVKASELPLPPGATDVNRKQLVEQITFKSPSGVNALAAEFSKSLAAQGWKSDGSDLVTPSSAILKRERGQASLTIMLKPAGSGSQATIFTEGLDWGE